MVKVPYSLSELDQMAIAFYKDIVKEFDILKQLTNWKKDEMKPVMDHLASRLGTIICGRPDQLEAEIQLIQSIAYTAKQNYKIKNPLNSKGRPITDAQLNAWFKGEIFKVFDYDLTVDSFTKKDSGRLAYKLARKLNMNTCPYCNANYTFTIRKKKLKARPQFDHFYNKGRYPYLSLSFYNLIPSCALCNSGALKGQKVFSLAKNIHPYLESIENIYQFRTKIDAVDFLVSSNSFELKMVLCAKMKKSDPLSIKAKGNIEVFALDDRYKYHKDIAESVIKNSYIYSNTAVEDLYKTFEINGKRIFNSELEVKELIVGNYLSSADSHRRIHTKLVKDIAEEFGLVI
ncbi:hypothetical protein GON26_06605 [Flavobacterium sp. GA093]|uniref:HNH nuclease domain-containing protein n=1 Tax=Flavobacterium hydrocarbonoxydans TaxID=2683249 RepID=A0A6I4NHS5_9FLAO|nr:hypothetical protein [Flavobacterium hydrocarbonoxydans]MWB94026.1 hypothetical protein [Flavobacterium hydrocarbonoxydans]